MSVSSETDDEDELLDTLKVAHYPPDKYLNSEWTLPPEAVEYSATTLGCGHCKIIMLGISLLFPGETWTEISRLERGDHALRVDFPDGWLPLDFFVEKTTARDATKELFDWSGSKLELPARETYPFHKAVPRIPGTGSNESVARARAWIGDCEANHGSCRNSASRDDTVLPRRVLDLGSSAEPVSADVKLVETTGDQRGRYITLSHCWGKVMPVKTTRETISAHKRVGIAFDDLPKTFRDAAITCRKLGVRWLWIDSLCIIQDDEGDWKSEASKMAEVYSNSWLTIAATKAADSSQGCFADGEAPPIHVCQLSHEGELYNVFVSEFFDVKHESTRRWRLAPNSYLYQEKMYFCDEAFPLMNRRWAFQERLLSPRVLHFGPAELFFECRERYVCQCERTVLPEKGSLALKGMDTTLPETWREICQKYSRAQLTFPERDTLPALAGIARRFSVAKRGRYVAGVWEGELIESLLWRCTLQGSAKPEGEVIRRDERLPSWSWASAGRQISFVKGIQKPWISLQGIDIVLDGTDPFGEAQYAHITVEGDVLPAIVDYDNMKDIRVGDLEATGWSDHNTPDRGPLAQGEKRDRLCSYPNHLICIDDWWQDSYDGPPTWDIFLLLVGNNKGPGRTGLNCLILTRHTEATYKRIGWCRISNYDKILRHKRRMTMTIT
ncbi:hypothetical protein MAPG_11287 [Magnaporthiopsis poae ATCC 64411]|uniref:Heterokaryon incompatibility domain-containing protein n=1 Tax=Magnaporthiopsis poae (strain ATCC 64411 / 73-15) TaxID=644358 RepID=A0A0C4EEV5_MAGP6|nr:hypothetical protein MAPG_11287 [Magnaporthiopsis poae ATCC 64411]